MPFEFFLGKPFQRLGGWIKVEKYTDCVGFDCFVNRFVNYGLSCTGHKRNSNHCSQLKDSSDWKSHVFTTSFGSACAKNQAAA
jgi:hypothetical protein